MTSILPASCGIQKEWMTSWLVSSMRTGRPTGMWISLAVVKTRLGFAALVAHAPPPLRRRDLKRQRRLALGIATAATVNIVQTAQATSTTVETPTPM